MSFFKTTGVNYMLESKNRSLVGMVFSVEASFID